jgi:uncharacterized protein YqiB (DUF1249 family)
MSAVREETTHSLSERAWRQLETLESLHRQVQQNHDRVVRTLDAATMSDDQRTLQIAWNQYRAVVADLCRVTEDIESLRMTPS